MRFALTALIVASMLTAGVVAQTTTTSAPARVSIWEPCIKAWEAEDAQNPPPKDQILFIGSSSMALWTSLAQDMAPLTVIRRGYGGSTIGDSVGFAYRIVVPYRPRAIVFYAGENDLGGKSPEQVLEDFRAMVAIVHKELPHTPLMYVSAKPSIARAGMLPRVRKLNSLIQQECEKDDRLIFIDVFSPMVNAKGQPRGELLSSDNLHMNAQGYKLWTSIIKPRLPEVSPVVRALRAGKKQHIVTYGTSLTDGNSWVADMLKTLQADFGDRVTVTNSARSGMASAWGLENLKERVLDKKPDAVFIEFAVNDALTSGGITVDKARENLQAMIDAIHKENKDCQIVLMTMNVPLKEHAASRPKLEEFYQMYREVAAKRGLALIDHHLVWKDLLARDAALYAKYVPDGMHPGSEGNTKIVLPAVLDMLYGRPAKLSPQQRELEKLRASLLFGEPVLRGSACKLKLPVTNTGTETVTFSGKWLMEKADRVEPAEVKAFELAPGKSTELTFEITASMEAPTAPALSWSASTRSVVCEGTVVPTLLTSAAYVLGAPTAEAAPAKAQLPLAHVWQVVPWARPRWKGPANCSARASLYRTEKDLRVVVDVTDDKLLAAGKNSWDNDAVQVFFDFRTAQQREKREPGGLLEVIAVPHFHKTMGNQAFTQPPSAAKDFVVKSETTKTGYRVDLTLPLAALEKLYGPIGDELHFDVGVCDSDEPGKITGLIHWSDGDSSAHTPHAWGVVAPAKP